MQKLQIEIPKKLMAKKLEGEWVFLNLENGEYYGLNETGSLVWDTIREKKDPEAAVSRLQETYQLERTRAQKDVANLLKDLEEQGLIRIEKLLKKS